jgi:NAD+ synthase
MQKQIVEEMKVKPIIDIQEEIRVRIDFIKNELINSNLKTLVLGISGGQDSTLLGKLAQMAIDELNQEDDDYSFIAMRLPYGIQFDEEDCQLAIEFIKPNKVITSNIKSAVDSIVEDFKNSDVEITDFNKGNIKARIRMVNQYALAGSVGALVLGTDHSSENITGFFTKHGDGACDIAPLFGLNKRQGKQLLRYLNAPSILIDKIPTADLEEEKPANPDEISLGISYDEIDDYLEGKEINVESKNILENHYIKSRHKRILPKTIY